MVHRDEKLLGHFDSITPWAQEAVQEIADCLSAAGYGLELMISDSERRILDCGPEGIRVMHSEPIFRRDN